VTPDDGAVLRLDLIRRLARLGLAWRQRRHNNKEHTKSVA
jgi:hypothetical protein